VAPLSPLNGVEGFGGFELGIHVPKNGIFHTFPGFVLGVGDPDEVPTMEISPSFPKNSSPLGAPNDGSKNLWVFLVMFLRWT